MHKVSKYLNGALLATAALLLSLPASAQTWWVEAGPVVRGNMSVSSDGASYSQRLGLHDPMAAGPLAAPAGLGSATAYADRAYDNGYVKIDPGTGNPTSLDPNTTWNWGFSDPAQYNSSAGTLRFQKQGAPGYTATTDSSSGPNDDMLGAGVQLSAGLRLKTSANWSFDLALGFQGIWGGKQTVSGTTYAEDVRRITVRDTYDVSGIPSASFPAGGFQGTYLGPFDNPPVVPSPVIPNLPQSRARSVSGALSSSYNNVDLEVDQSLYQISLGPQIGWTDGSRLHLRLRPTVSANILDADLTRTETFTQVPAGGSATVLNRWSDAASGQEVLFGLGVTGGADYDLGKGFYAGLFGGYEWVVDKMDIEVGPSKVHLDPSGWVAGLVLGKRF